MDTTANGARLLLDEIKAQLEKKRLSEITRLQLRVDKYQLENLIEMRQDVRVLKSHDMIQKSAENPKLAAFVFLLVLVINSMVNWAGVRKPLLQAFFLHVFGILIPLDSIW